MKDLKIVVSDDVNKFQGYVIKPGTIEKGYVPVALDVTPFDNSKTSKDGGKDIQRI